MGTIFGTRLYPILSVIVAKGPLVAVSAHQEIRMMIDAISANSDSHRIAARISQAIHEHRLAPGTKLSEEEVSDDDKTMVMVEEGRSGGNADERSDSEMSDKDASEQGSSDDEMSESDMSNIFDDLSCDTLS